MPLVNWIALGGKESYILTPILKGPGMVDWFPIRNSQGNFGAPRFLPPHNPRDEAFLPSFLPFLHTAFSAARLKKEGLSDSPWPPPPPLGNWNITSANFAFPPSETAAHLRMGEDASLQILAECACRFPNQGGAKLRVFHVTRKILENPLVVQSDDTLRLRHSARHDNE